MYQELDGLTLQTLAAMGQGQRRLRSASPSALPKVLAEAAVAVTKARASRVFAIRGTRVVPVAAEPGTGELGNPMSVEDSGFADVIDSAKARLGVADSTNAPGVPGAVVPVTVEGEVTAILAVCAGEGGFLTVGLELLIQLGETAAARTAELERQSAQRRQVLELRDRLALIEGDPSRGRRRGDDLAPDGADAGSLLTLEQLAAEVPCGILTTRLGPDGWQVVHVNELLATMLGRETADLSGLLDQILTTGEGGPRIDPVELLTAEPNTPFQTELIRPDGTDFDVWLYAMGQLSTDPVVVIGVIDVSRHVRRLRELERMARTDPVTGLANRTRATEVLEDCLREDRQGSVAVMLLDLDRFKNVNDSLGHGIGDMLLVEVTQRLRSLVPPRTVVARLGGDEFLLILRDLDDILDVHPLAYGLLESLAEPYDLRSGHRVTSSVSIGIGLSSRPDLSATDLIREADLAMYRAKDLGRNRYAVCDATMLQAADQRLEREMVLRRGLEHDRLRLRLQPIVDLATGRLVEFEALVRLADPERGEVPPDEFIPIAEETGLISQIDHWVIEEALSLFSRDTRLMHHPEVRIAVNISGRTLERMDFMSRLVVALNQHGVEANRLVVEITESCLLGDNRAILWTLKQLRERGATIAIDDFGTGYSSLSYLQSFKVDILKIDQSFVSRINEGDGGDMMVANLVRLAHDLGLHVVAEGVEETEQAEALRSFNCDLAQGWLYGRPEVPQTEPIH